MKKLIYIACWVLLLTIISENINLIYAESDIPEESEIDEIFNTWNDDNDNEWLSLDDRNNNSDLVLNIWEIKNIDFESIINDENIVDNKIQDYFEEQTEDTVGNVNIINNESTLQDDLNLSKLEDVQIFEAKQAQQHIDTSSYDIIRIADPSNPRKWITIHDRNLWAITTWAWTDAPDTSYWYYYQWWNNYWFPTTWNIENTLDYSDTNVDASSYWPTNPYSSDTFIKWNSDWSHVLNNNLWGWSWDSKNNGRWYPIENPETRQWPCPVWYHVPSIWEWSELLNFWGDSYTWSVSVMRDYSTNLRSFEGYPVALNNFYNKFNIPVAGNLSYETSIPEDIWSQALLRSSSPLISSNWIFRLFWVGSDLYTKNWTNKRANWFPIRCFYNSYRLPVKIIYDLDWWYWSWENNSEKKLVIYTGDDGLNYSPNIELPTPKKWDSCWANGDKKCIFAWWFLWTGNEDKMRTWNIYEDLTVFAKWLPFEDKDVTLSRVNFTIMDRNLWAINTWTGENSYGYYLAWWEKDIMCPEWYHIPSTLEWKWIWELLGSDFNWNYIRDLLALPFAGKFTNNEIVLTWEDGYYLAKNGDEIMYTKINGSSIIFENLSNWEKVSARCFKNYNTWTIRFHSNWWSNIDNIPAVNRRERWEELYKPERENSIFSWWYTTSDFQEWTKIERNINYKDGEEIDIYARWECEEWYQENNHKCEIIYYDITWIDGDGNVLKNDKVKWWDIPVYNWATPTKNSTYGYDYTFNEKWTPDISIAKWNAIYTAQFDANRKSGWWSSSWWGGRKSSTIDTHWSADSLIQSEVEWNAKFNTWEMNIIYVDNDNIISSETDLSHIQGSSLVESEWQNWFSHEFIDAYNFAKKYWITTVDSISEAKMYSPLTRIEMAKMLSYYAINVLWKKPDVSKWMMKFSDVTNKLEAEYNNAVILAYQLWIMWQNVKNNEFRPNDEVTRVEFSTALSRLLYWTEDWTWNVKYYEPHMAKLYNEWIISKADPKIKEKRWYVMIMLMRWFKYN